MQKPGYTHGKPIWIYSLQGTFSVQHLLRAVRSFQVHLSTWNLHRVEPVNEFMRLLSIEYPWNLSVSEPSSHWFKDGYHVFLTWAHQGVHPTFKIAATSLYRNLIRKNLRYRNIVLSLLNDSPLRARIYFLFFVQARPLIKFTEYHHRELNQLESELLPQIYVSIRGIQKIKRSILLGKSNASLTAEFACFTQADSFRLLALLSQISFERN